MNDFSNTMAKFVNSKDFTSSAANVGFEPIYGVRGEDEVRGEVGPSRAAPVGGLRIERHLARFEQCRRRRRDGLSISVATTRCAHISCHLRVCACVCVCALSCVICIHLGSTNSKLAGVYACIWMHMRT